jgi:hypothetical protein
VVPAAQSAEHRFRGRDGVCMDGSRPWRRGAAGLAAGVGCCGPRGGVGRRGSGRGIWVLPGLARCGAPPGVSGCGGGADQGPRVGYGGGADQARVSGCGGVADPARVSGTGVWRIRAPRVRGATGLARCVRALAGLSAPAIGLALPLPPGAREPGSPGARSPGRRTARAASRVGGDATRPASPSRAARSRRSRRRVAPRRALALSAGPAQYPAWARPGRPGAGLIAQGLREGPRRRGMGEAAG